MYCSDYPLPWCTGASKTVFFLRVDVLHNYISRPHCLLISVVFFYMCPRIIFDYCADF